MKKTMYVLTCNGWPLCVSENEGALKERRKEVIDRLVNDDYFEILSADETTVHYHDGISYLCNNYTIFEVEVI